MRILALNGSHRGDAGCTQWLLTQLAAGARECGADFEIIPLANYKIMPCTGCETCHTEENYLQCVFDGVDDVKEIHAKMRSADILVFATPVYVFSMTGLMKTFLDRFNSTVGTGKLCVTKSGLFFGKVDKDFHSKPFVILSCCGNVEEAAVENVVSYFKTFSKFLDAPIVGALIRKSIGMMKIDSAQGTDGQNPLITEVRNAYTQAGRELALQGRITAKTQKKANRQLLNIPFLNLLMKFSWFKRMAIRKMQARESD